MGKLKIVLLVVTGAIFVFLMLRKLRDREEEDPIDYETTE